MKKYNLKPQEKDNYCACSVVQAIFDSHGIKMSQDEIASKLSPSEKGFYIDDEKFTRLILSNKFNYELYGYNCTPFNEPDMLFKENADIFIAWNNHVVLVNNFDDPEVSYINPDKGINEKKNLGEILRLMHKSEIGLFGVLKKI